MGAYVGIDEVALFRDELYTILMNKKACGKKGSIILIIKRADVCTISHVLLKLSCRRRYQVRKDHFGYRSQYGTESSHLFFYPQMCD